MLIALFAFLFGLITHGPEQVFIAPDVQKNVKKYVEKKERRDEINAVLKDGKKEIASFKKEQEKLAKMIQKEILSKSSSRSKVESLLDSSLEIRKGHQNSYVEMRLKIQEVFSQEEWDKVIKNAVYPSDKDSIREEKATEKTKKAYINEANKIKVNIQKVIVDQDKRERSVAAYETFRDEYSGLIDMRTELNYKNLEVLRNKQASKEQLEAFYTKQNETRERLYSSFNDFFSSLKENTTDDEWKRLKKEIAKIFKV